MKVACIKLEEEKQVKEAIFYQILSTDTFNAVFEILSTGNSSCCPKVEVKANTKVCAFVCSRIAAVRGKDGEDFVEAPMGYV